MTVPEQGDVEPGPAPSKASRSTVIRVVFLLAVVAFAAYAIVKERHSLAQAWEKVQLFPVLVGLVLSIAGAFCGFPQWKVLLAGLGSEIPFGPASRVFFIGQLGKYIPGGVWNIVAQATMAKELKVPRARTGAAGLLAIVVALPVVAAIAAVTLAIAGRQVLGAYWWALLLVVPLLAFLQPDVLVRLAAFAARVIHRKIPLERVPGRSIARATVWTAIGQVLSGLSLMLLVAMFTGSYPSPLLLIGIFSLGLLAGMVVVFAPAGAGPREAVIVLGLSPYMDHGAALLVALLARILSIVADGALAGGAGLAGRRARDAPGTSRRRGCGGGQMTELVSRVLFVTRKFPPSVGGMETLASDVWKVVQGRWPGSCLIAHGGPNWRSLFWGPPALFKVARLLRAGQVDAIIAGDAVMATALRAVLWVRRVPAIAFVMGRDLTWDKPGYRAMVRWGLRRWDLIAAISSATGTVAGALTSDPAKVEVIRLGVSVPVTVPDAAVARAAIVRRWGLAESDLILLTLGRVVRRKGAAWFAGQVLPLLPDARYVVAGVGPDADAVAAAAAAAGVSARLVLTGAVTEEEREDLLAGCDVFVQPNIPVPGDMEGFGLVVVEAALRGAVVLAAGLEGLVDAVEDGRTGVLVATGEPATWAERIGALGGMEQRRARGADFRAAATELYGREQMGRRLAEMFRVASTKTAGH